MEPPPLAGNPDERGLSVQSSRSKAEAKVLRRTDQKASELMTSPPARVESAWYTGMLPTN
jgi:hypothetical protein